MNPVKYIWRCLIVGSSGLTLLACGQQGAQLDGGAAPDAAELAAAGPVRLLNKKANLAAQAPAAAGDIVTAAPGDDGLQQWQLKEVGDNKYALINQTSKLALMAGASASTPGAHVVQAAPNGADVQRWNLSQQGGGTYQLKNVANGLCLDVSFGSMRPDAFLQLWTCANSDEMLWSLLSTDAAAAAPAADPAPAQAPAPSAAYSMAQLQADLKNVLQLRAPKYSNRNLGNPANVALWTPDKMQSLMRGIQTAQRYFPKIGLVDLAHLILAEGAQESTGNFAMPGVSVGFMQVTPGTVGIDFKNHGMPIKAADGSVVVSPQSSPDLNDPAQNIALWAWYSSNVVIAGMSLNEVALNNQPFGKVTRDFGNAEFDWLAGPHNDRHDASKAANFKDYHDRIKDYFVQSDFGSDSQFEALLATPLGSKLVDCK